MCTNNLIYCYTMTLDEIIENWSIKDHGHLVSDEISWDDYFMDIARVVWEKCTCDRGKCWCVIVRDHDIISSGFANAPDWSDTCDKVGHQMLSIINEDWEKEEHCMRNNCAEQNAIASAARRWIALEWATLYVTMTPCTVRHCAHMIVACGIKRVVCDKRYKHWQESEKIFKRAWVELVYLNNWIVQY